MNIFLLGACGSIGTQTLDVMRTYNNDFKLIACSIGRDVKKGMEIIREFRPLCVCLRDESMLKRYQNEFPDVDFCFGDEGLIKVATYHKETSGTLVNAVMGSVGLKPTVEAIKIGRDIAIANKETLVVAGEIVTSLAKEYGVKLLPIDSEHSAIMQCLNGERHSSVKRLIITASGGAFRDKTRDELKSVKKEDALKHPNWSMGEKITIDSASMMNKGLEVIEAHFLFDIPYEQIDTVMHRESVIHSMVEFKDSSIMAQMGTPDMRIPIIHALGYPDRLPFESSLDLLSLPGLHFEKLDLNRFPCLQIAYECGKKSGIMPCVMNAANEAAVNLFLEDKIGFLDIEDIIREEIDSVKNILNPTLEEILYYDSFIKSRVYKRYGGIK